MHGRDLVMLVFIWQLPHAVENNLFWLIFGFFCCCCWWCCCWSDILLSYIIEWDSNNISNYSTETQSCRTGSTTIQCMGLGKRKMKTELKITLFVSHINCCYCHTMNGKIERVSILLLDQHTNARDVFLRRKYTLLFFKKKDVKVWSNLKVQKASERKSFNTDSMHCLWTTRQLGQSINQTGLSPMWHSNQLRDWSTKSRKPYTRYTTAPTICGHIQSTTQ